MQYSLKEIANVVGGKIIGNNNIVDNLLFDSRDTNRNISSIFLAIKSSDRNGHDYINDMVLCGVISYIIEESFENEAQKIIENNNQIGFVIVDNSIKAIQILAKFHRSTLSTNIIAITGSNGKTITKEWIVQMMPNRTIFRSPKSFNSQLGVPLSILMIDKNEKLAIIEVGISQLGEMDILESIVKPNGVIITNINSAHLENFPDKHTLFEEKMKLVKNAKFVVYNSDNTLINNYIIEKLPTLERFTWGGENSDIQSSYKRDVIEFTHNKKTYCTTPYFTDFGSYENAMNAITFIAKLGGDITIATNEIERLESVEMRLQLMEGTNNCRLINDVYSNDIHSLIIALNYMSTISPNQKHIVILSDFVQSNDSIYLAVKEILSKYNISKIYLIGKKIGTMLNSLPFEQKCFDTTEDFCKQYDTNKFSNSTILIKGSRKFSFEKIVALLQEKMHSTTLNIDLEALVNNYKTLKKYLLPRTKTVAMVKALAYGCGTYEIASSFCDAGVDYLAVAYLDEGITLREKGITKPIIILNSTSNDFELIVKHKLQPEIYSITLLKEFVKYCSSKNITGYPIHLKLDSGMNRLGIKPDRIEPLYKVLKNTKTIKVDSIFSHLSSADDSEMDDVTKTQIELFDSISQQLITDLGLENTLRHICNSAGVVRFPEAHFDMVRLGIALYGISSIKGLNNVSSLHSSIIQIKDIKKGEYIGYNQKGVANKDSKIAIIAIGYADGLNRLLSQGKWSMKIDGHKAPIIGNISMDNCAIDITGLNVAVGDDVVVFDCAEDIVSMAEITGTIPYEILTSISTRIKRRYYR